jgi:uncharacterized RDD family membrane protein YckC
MFCTRCGAQNAETIQFCKQCGAPFVPASVPVVGPGPAAPQFHYAGFWLRFWAYLIDCLILGLLPILISLIIAPLFFTGVAALAFLGIWIFIVPVMLAEGWLYYALMESSSYQGTLGKRALGLKVTGMSGEPITFGSATIRYFCKLLSALMLHIGFIMAAFTEKKQALHDIIASCLVIRN